jgi:hypothetical protein
VDGRLGNPKKKQLKVWWFLHPMILLGLKNHPFGDAGFRWPIHSK